MIIIIITSNTYRETHRGMLYYGVCESSMCLKCATQINRIESKLKSWKMLYSINHNDKS